jgi:hypothetical protein
MYEELMSLIIERAILTSQIANSLFLQALSPKQRELVEKHLKTKHPDLLLPYLSFQRRLVEGLAFDLS